MDATEASNALTEMQQRTQQTLRQGSPRLPGWYVASTAAALVIMVASSDLSGWYDTAMSLAGALALIVLAAVLERVTGVRLRMRSLRWAPLVLFAVALLATLIGVGTLMRLYDVAADDTIAGVATALVWAAAVNKVQAAAIRKPA